MKYKILTSLLIFLLSFGLLAQTNDDPRKKPLGLGSYNIGGTDLTKLNSDIIPDTDAAYSIGSTTYGFQDIYFDNGVTDGGACYFDGSNTSYLKSSADGLTMTLGGFTSLLSGTDASCSLGSTSYGYKDLYLDNGATDGGQIYFDGSNVSKIKSTNDGVTLSIEGFSNFNSAIANNFFSHTYPYYPSGTNLGSASYPWKWLYLDYDTTDGGGIFFNKDANTFLKSTADGLTLNVGGFTTLGFAANQTTTIGSTTYHPLAMHSVTYYLDSGTTNYGYVGIGSAGGAGGALLLNHATSHIGIVTNAGGGVYFSTGHVSPETDNQPDLGTTSKYWKNLYLKGKIYSGATTTVISAKRLKVTKTYTDFATAGLTNDLEVLSLPAGAHIIDIYANLTTEFTGGTIASYTIAVGVAADHDKYLEECDCFTAAASFLAPSDKGAVITTPVTTNVENFSTATSIRAYAVSTVGNLNAATQGSIDIYIEYIDAN